MGERSGGAYGFAGGDPALNSTAMLETGQPSNQENLLFEGFCSLIQASISILFLSVRHLLADLSVRVLALGHGT
jgi:hypothetical protein